ncbi:MAG: DoxX family protein [Enhygromyxa sp.]
MKEHGTRLNLALWIAAALVAVLFLAAGGAKIAGWLDQQFVEWGYSPGFAVLIGVFEVLFAIALLIKRSAAWAAFGLMAIMLGAIGTHLTHGEYPLLLLPVSVFLLLAFVAWGRGPERSPIPPQPRVAGRPAAFRV